MRINTHNHVGDYICLTAVVHNIYQQTHQVVEVDCRPQYASIFQDNPYAKVVQPSGGIFVKYPGSQAKSDKGNLCEAYSLDALQQLGLKPQIKYRKPELYFHREKPEGLPYKYVVIAPGYQINAAVKNWGRYNWQNFVDKFHNSITFVQTGQLSRTTESPYLQNVVPMVGKTDLQTLISLISFSSGVVCHASNAAHIAAAFNIPAIYIIGNREGPRISKYDCTWPAQSNLPCGPCMKFHCGAGNPMKTCTNPVIMVNQLIPKCMAMLNIDELFKSKILSRVT